MSILVENISKNFGGYQLLDRINLEIKTGSLVGLIGPSGSGKSTLLRVVAGLEKPDSGRIWFHGKEATNLELQKREIGFVFQNYALFPHLTVWENIAFGLNIRQVDVDFKNHRIQELLKLIQLEKFAHRYPKQLSGGQRQRVAFARALAVEPKILLLDEPFSALDAKIRKQLRSWLRNFHPEIAVTTVFVTHDHQEALEVADELAVLENGHISQIGSPEEISDYPSTSFIKSFLEFKKISF